MAEYRLAPEVGVIGREIVVSILSRPCDRLQRGRTEIRFSGTVSEFTDAMNRAARDLGGSL